LADIQGVKGVAQRGFRGNEGERGGCRIEFMIILKENLRGGSSA